MAAATFASPTLSFYRIYDQPFPGAVPVLILRFGLHGYRNAKPDLQVTRLVSAKADFSISDYEMLKKGGAIAQKGIDVSHYVNLTLEADDAIRMENLSRAALHSRVLLLVDSDPIMAPTMQAPLKESVQISMGKNDESAANALIKKILPMVAPKDGK